MRGRKLSNLMFGVNPLKIKNRIKLHKIYEDFLQRHYASVCEGIHNYDKNESVFFTDLLLYIRDKYKNESYKHDIYWRFYEIYFEELNIE